MSAFRLIAVLGLIASASPLGAQAVNPMPGRVVERATAGEDTSQTFAIYYPAAYTDTSTSGWPLLFVMDPRGRAMLALRLFAPAAEKHGFVVVSSYNTLSDGAVEPNIGAANAMLTAAQTTIAADMRRLYIAGFSGTARIAWAFELEAPKVFAGILSAGAAPIFNDSVGSRALLHAPGFAIALTTGTTDFNAAEVRLAREWLWSENVAAHEEEYAGPHSWPPPPLIEHALAWFKLRGMLGGRWPMDSAWVRQRLHDEAKRADSLASSGRLLDAVQVYQDLDGLGSQTSRGADIRARENEIASNPAVLNARKRLFDLDNRYLATKAETSIYLATLHMKAKPASADEIIRTLQIPALKETATQSDSLEKQWAQRVLALLGASLGFYEPRIYLDQNRPLQAIAMLEASTALGQWGPGQCDMYTQALAGLKENDRRNVVQRMSAYSASCK